MLYKEYLNAARKHLFICKVLENKLGDGQLRDHEKKYCLINLYYLTGYVFECSIKYGIYKSIDYDKEKDVNQLNHEKMTFDKNIKHHRFSKYDNFLIQKVPGIKLVDDNTSNSKDVQHLYNTWDAEVRYWYKDAVHKTSKKLTEKNVLDFLNCAESAFKKISTI